MAQAQSVELGEDYEPLSSGEDSEFVLEDLDPNVLAQLDQSTEHDLDALKPGAQTADNSSLIAQMMSDTNENERAVSSETPKVVIQRVAEHPVAEKPSLTATEGATVREQSPNHKAEHSSSVTAEAPAEAVSDIQTKATENQIPNSEPDHLMEPPVEKKKGGHIKKIGYFFAALLILVLLALCGMLAYEIFVDKASSPQSSAAPLQLPEVPVYQEPEGFPAVEAPRNTSPLTAGTNGMTESGLSQTNVATGFSSAVTTPTVLQGNTPQGSVISTSSLSPNAVLQQLQQETTAFSQAPTHAPNTVETVGLVEDAYQPAVSMQALDVVSQQFSTAAQQDQLLDNLADQVGSTIASGVPAGAIRIDSEVVDRALFNNNLSSLQQSVTVVSDVAYGNSQQITAMQSALSDITEILSGIQKDVQGIKAQVDGYATELADLSLRFDGMEKEVKALKERPAQVVVKSTVENPVAPAVQKTKPIVVKSQPKSQPSSALARTKPTPRKAIVVSQNWRVGGINSSNNTALLLRKVDNKMITVVPGSIVPGFGRVTRMNRQERWVETSSGRILGSKGVNNAG